MFADNRTLALQRVLRGWLLAVDASGKKAGQKEWLILVKPH